MAFTSTDPFFRATLDSIGVLAQTNADFKEISLRLSISRQDIYWRVRASKDYADDFQSLSSQAVTKPDEDDPGVPPRLKDWEQHNRKVEAYRKARHFNRAAFPGFRCVRR